MVLACTQRLSCVRAACKACPRVPRVNVRRRGRRGRSRALPQVLQAGLEAAQQSQPGFATGFTLATVVFVLGVRVLLAGLTPAGYAASYILGGTIFSAFGAGGFAYVCLYFIFGSAATKFRLQEKEAKGIAEKRSGRRGVGSVIGSGIAGIACGLAALATGNAAMYTTGFVASFASKLSDTMSSEIGKGYGRSTYSITQFKQVPPGTEGAVSLEGTAAGIATAVLYSSTAVLLGLVDIKGAAICGFAATVANIAESYIGALVQGKVAWLTNDVVNAIQIGLASLVAIALHAVFH